DCLATPRDLQLHWKSGWGKIKKCSVLGQGIDRYSIDACDHIAGAQTSGFCGAALIDVGDDDAPILRELEASGQIVRDGLCVGSNRDGTNNAVCFDLVASKTHDGFGDCEAQTFAASAGGEDEGVDA